MIKAAIWRGISAVAFKIADGLVALGEWAYRRGRLAQQSARRQP
jgi:hypothetical protein